MNLGTTAVLVLAVLFGLSSIVVFMRCIVRFRIVKNHGWDDYLILGAFVFNLAQLICVKLGVHRVTPQRMIILRRSRAPIRPWKAHRNLGFTYISNVLQGSRPPLLSSSYTDSALASACRHPPLQHYPCLHKVFDTHAVSSFHA